MRLFTSGGSDAGSASGGGPGRGAGGDGGRQQPPAESVSQLAERIKSALDGVGGPLRVRGELSNVIDKGHWYFSLKDDEAVIGCAMWREAAERARRSGFTLRDGDAVVVTGALSFYAKQGRTQLYVTSIEREGQGSLQERYERLRRTLEARGYFDDDRKLPLPAFPRRIAIVTSATGAAMHDCLRTAAHRAKAVGILLVDVRVQGDGAAEQVARAVRALDAQAERLGIDAILVTRGGGSIEDLWAFNEEIVADAVFARRSVPIVAAIGHESDTTIIEFVADRRASTPTQAIMLLTPDVADLSEQLASMGDRLSSVLRRSVRTRREVLARIERHAFLRSPLAPIDAARGRLGELARRLERTVTRRLGGERDLLRRLAGRCVALRPDRRIERERERLGERLRGLERTVGDRLRRERLRLASAMRQLEAVSPERVLQRGYSYTETEAGELLRSVAQAPPGTALRTTLVDGVLRSVVSGSPETPELPGGVLPARAPKRLKQHEEGEGRLF